MSHTQRHMCVREYVTCSRPCYLFSALTVAVFQRLFLNIYKAIWITDMISFIKWENWMNIDKRPWFYKNNWTWLTTYHFTRSNFLGLFYSFKGFFCCINIIFIVLMSNAMVTTLVMINNIINSYNHTITFFIDINNICFQYFSIWIPMFSWYTL